MEKEINNVVAIIDGVESSNYEVNREGQIISYFSKEPVRISNVSGRNYVSLNLGEQTKYCQVGRVVLESFVGKSNVPDHDKVGFKDGDCGNDSLDNLFWTDKRKWWLDPLTNISIHVIHKIAEANKNYPWLKSSEIAKKINVPRDLMTYVLINLQNDVIDESQNESPVESPIENEPQENNNLTVIEPITIDEKFEEIFGIVSVDTTYNKILSEEIPALEYAGVNQKKILKYILYKHGKDIYEYFKEKQMTI